MKIDKNTTLKIAKLTRIKIKDSEIDELSNQIDTETLIMFWQFTIKTLDELNIVLNQNLSIEMFLIRLIHLKKIPKLENLLDGINTSQNLETPKGIQICLLQH